MIAASRHAWDLAPADARALQAELAREVVLEDSDTPPRLIAGMDCGFEEQGRITRAAVVLMTFPELETVASVIARRPTTFPYVPGLLSFRELPAVLEALERLDRRPDLLLCDGQGIAHPRGLGIACHLGVLLDLPAVGVGKSRLVGEFTEPGRLKGDRSPLRYRGEVIGAVLRSRTDVRPLFVSPGHRVSVDTAIGRVLQCCTKYRLPEPVRAADRLASRKP